jgi:hypothetical protein
MRGNQTRGYLNAPKIRAIPYPASIKHSISLAKSIKAKVAAVTVSAPIEGLAFELMTDTSEQYKKHAANLAAEHLRVATDMATAAGVNCNVVHVEHHQPYEAIIIAAKKAHCDLIVMASHGRRGYAAVLLVYRTRFFGHKFELSGLLHAGFLPGDTCVVRTA